MNTTYTMFEANGNDPALTHIQKMSGETTARKAIARFVNNLLGEYKRKCGSFRPPIDPLLLAELVDAVVEAAPASITSEGHLLPVKGGFVIRYRTGVPLTRTNLTICHEIAHTFFYEHSSPIPKRLLGKQPTQKEEQLCYLAARELLVPTELLSECLHEIRNLPPLRLLSKLADSFEASLPIIACRVTHDTSLIDDAVFTFWGSGNKSNTDGVQSSKDRQKGPAASSFSPKYSFVSPSAAELANSYWRRLVLEAAVDSVKGVATTGVAKSILLEIGKRKRFRFRLEAHSWGSGRVVSAVSPR